jgi:hypothetical protein
MSVRSLIARRRSLQDCIFRAVDAFSKFLDRNGVIREFGLNPDDPDWPRLKVRTLVVTLEYGRSPGVIDITLKDGALDRVYGNSVNPDPDGPGPPDIPHKRRAD